MEDIKLTLTHAVAGKLTAAPDGPAKDELVEELSDNLYHRFLDMTGAGVSEQEAFDRAMDDLGDVDELLAYLGVEQPRQGDNGPVVINIHGGEDKSQDVQRIVINDAGETKVINPHGEDAEAARKEAEAARTEAEAAWEKAEAGRTGAQRAHQAGQGDVHYDYDYSAAGDTVQSDLDAIMANVGEICRVAMEQVKDAAVQARDAIKRRTSVQRDNGHVKVHFDTVPETPEPPEAPEAPEIPEAPATPEPPKGWAFEAEVDSDEGRFFAGAGPKQRKDIVYGFGYDKAKGGFFTQWGEYRGDPQPSGGPHFTGEGAFMEHQDDDSYSVTALKDLRGIRVQTAAGDVTIHADQAPDAGVVIDGDVDDLDVTCSADGVLTIREGRTASSSFFFRRGIGSADVELYLPCRLWESIEVTTASGDVDIDGDLEIEHLAVNTANGDLSCHIRSCTRLQFKSASGDLDFNGDCVDIRAETMSGDLCLEGQTDRAELKSASGDIHLDGSVGLIRASSMSGDVEVETSILPQTMDLSSKSGDCQARIPDAGPFSIRMKTVSGEMDCEFPVNYVNGTFIYGDGSGPAYSMTSISGDVWLARP